MKGRTTEQERSKNPVQFMSSDKPTVANISSMHLAQKRGSGIKKSDKRKLCSNNYERATSFTSIDVFLPPDSRGDTGRNVCTFLIRLSLISTRQRTPLHEDMKATCCMFRTTTYFVLLTDIRAVHNEPSRYRAKYSDIQPHWQTL